MTSNHPLFAGIDQRIELDREEGDIAYLNALLLKLEFLTKMIVAGVVACIDDDVDRCRYSLEHRLVRADSLGNWTDVLNTALVGPPAQSIVSEARTVTRDLTQQVGADDIRYSIVTELRKAAAELGCEVNLGDRVALRQFFDIAVQVRNRSKGHGAPTAHQSQNACPHLMHAISSFVSEAAILKLSWVHLHQNLSSKYRVSRLLNDSSPFDYLKRRGEVKIRSGVYFHLGPQTNAVNPRHVSLVFTSSDLNDIALPNGNYKSSSFETLSYVTNDVVSVDGAEWSTAPERLPDSETEGSKSLEPMGNFFANVPPMHAGYVRRADIEERLQRELTNVDRHPIVTLTGPGGIGKTTSAIRAIEAISELDQHVYEVVLWISARDVDLLDAGPKPVSRSVFTQDDISKAVAELLEPAEKNQRGFHPSKYFERCLSKGAAGNTLFVLDNFETLQNPVDMFEWIDAHIRPPNKVLITTRYRDFRGDYYIPVTGMSDDEANVLIDQHASRLGISELIDSSYKKNLVAESDGHPYVIKILLGQVAKERQAVSPKRIVASSERLLETLFKRTYNALSPAAQRVFLLLSSWRVYVPQVAIEAISLRPGTERFDATRALEETIQFSLVDQAQSEKDEDRFVGAPLAASNFGQKELKVSPFRAAVEEDRKLLMGFGAGKKESAHKGVMPRIDNLIRSIASSVGTDSQKLESVLPILEYLAGRFPSTYLSLVDLVLESSRTPESIHRAKSYLRDFLRSVSQAEQHVAWEKLAELCMSSGDSLGEIHARCELALLPTSTHLVLGKVANRLNSRIRELKDRSDKNALSPEVSELLNKVIKVMERRLKELSATDCSSLAWLHLNAGASNTSESTEHQARALDVARIGLKKDSANYHCQRLVSYLE